MGGSLVEPNYCRSCGRLLDASEIICANCGRNQNEPAEVRESHQNLSPDEILALSADGSHERILHCVYCGNPNVKEVPALVDEAIQDGRTVFASSLEKPRKPELRGNYSVPVVRFVVLEYLFAIPGVAIFLMERSSGAPSAGNESIARTLLRFAIGCMIIALAFIPLSYARYKRDVSTVQHWLPRWQIALRRWERLLYCEKCDHISDIELDDSTDRSNYHRFVYAITEGESEPKPVPRSVGYHIARWIDQITFGK